MKTLHINNKPKIKLSELNEIHKVDFLIGKFGLNTICISGNCPNRNECWKCGTATFMILGSICSRACKFCGVENGKPSAPDITEPERVAEAIKEMNLRHCVITSVTRDDLPDKGSSFWATTIDTIRKINPGVTMETLIPDFNGKEELLKKVAEKKPEIISHNLETIKRLSPLIRSQAQYETSLTSLTILKRIGAKTKSGIMLGLGEKKEEVLELMEDVLSTGCKIFTIGQYYSPGKRYLPVKEFVSDEDFKFYKEMGLKMGFEIIESGKLVRSSYHAEQHI